MKNNDVSVNEAVVNDTEAPVAEVTKKEKKVKNKDPKELHSIMFLLAWVIGIVGIIFVLLAQNALNNDDEGFVSLSYHWFDEVLVDRKNQIFETQWTEMFWDIEFLTSALCSYIAMGLGLISTGCGIARNILKKDKKLVSYVCGVAVLVLGAFAFLADYYANLS